MAKATDVFEEPANANEIQTDYQIGQDNIQMVARVNS